jgi:prepilin-type processing-associated H-X9-DG protein
MRSDTTSFPGEFESRAKFCPDDLKSTDFTSPYLYQISRLPVKKNHWILRPPKILPRGFLQGAVEGLTLGVLRHGDGTTYAYADGHGEYWKWKDIDTVKMGRDRNRNHPGNYTPKASRISTDYRKQPSADWVTSQAIRDSKSLLSRSSQKSSRATFRTARLCSPKRYRTPLIRNASGACTELVGAGPELVRILIVKQYSNRPVNTAGCHRSTSGPSHPLPGCS